MLVLLLCRMAFFFGAGKWQMLSLKVIGRVLFIINIMTGCRYLRQRIWLFWSRRIAKIIIHFILTRPSDWIFDIIGSLKFMILKFNVLLEVCILCCKLIRRPIWHCLVRIVVWGNVKHYVMSRYLILIFLIFEH